MFDYCLNFLLIFGSFSAAARGEDYVYNNDVGYTTTTTSASSRPTSTSMTTTSRPTRTRRSVGDNECYAGDLNCDWKNDPSADQSWDPLYPAYNNSRAYGWLYSYFNGSSPRGNSSIRAISPILRCDDNYGCIDIHLQMFTFGGLVGLRVYQKPVHIALRDLIAYSDEEKKDYIIFEVWGDQGEGWNSKEIPLKHFDSNFQIILEGIFGELPVHMGICPMELMRRTECTVYTPYSIPNRHTTSTTISTTTTMSTTTTERAIRENGDTTTDKVMTTTWPTTLPATKQPTTTQEGNGCDSRNPPIILYLMAPANSLIDFRVRPPCSAGAGTYRLNDLRANIVGT